MHTANIAFSRYAESVLVAGTVVKKGTAANGVTAITSISDKPSGVVQEAKLAADILSSGDATVGVVKSGIAVLLAGAAITIDDELQFADDGRLVPKFRAGYVIGTAKTTAAAGEFFEALINIRLEGSVSAPTIAASAAVTAGKAVKVSSGAIVPIAATSDVPVGIATRSVSAGDITAGDDELVVATTGIVECLAGGNIAFGDALQVDADGDLVAKSAAGYVVGNALEAAASGETFLATINIRKEPA